MIKNIKLLIVGAGRMGIRHAIGAASSSNVEKITIIDIFEDALENAKNQLINQDDFSKFTFCPLEYLDSCVGYNTVIIATTAQNRISICKKVVQIGCENILIEKPLGQNITEVLELVDFFKTTKAKAYVNLNMRLYPDFIKLKNDLQDLPQFEGELNITINTGTIGIGANGIHYLDYLIFLLDSDEVKLITCQIDEKNIPSARGTQFNDYGGWCVLEFYKKNKKVGTSFLSMSSSSTVFGGFDIVGTHGRITINESSGQRIDYIRDNKSTMPINRYHADYLEPFSTKIHSPALSDLTKKWIEGLLKGEDVLPNLDKSLLAHKIMFEWLSNSKTKVDNFPIT